ncbi:MAG: hypothetical protein KBT27_10375, partial [Prevotellaceae bacterium]|nr:hypothetical protein [Candidatus Faecinaster equi]
KRISPFAYDGIVSGSENNKYSVHIETDHPRRSKCNCPFADGRRVVCKQAYQGRVKKTIIQCFA